MEIAADVASNLPRKLGLIDALAIVIGMVIFARENLCRIRSSQLQIPPRHPSRKRQT
jgi:hypothetical protein